MTQKGFTLIELMIVVAIVGILSVIAMTSMYQDYTIRARVTEGLVMASSAQLAVSETTQSNNVLPNDQAATGYVTPAATNNVVSIVIGAGGLITITYDAKATGGTLVLTPTLTANGDITWTCTAGTLAKKYLPANCR